ncbi:hypothetical protein ACQEV9_00630 [Streptomyces chartreusis]|uniref:hypothetical protein n=1 Tax=Streptomyces chartreusis TaxID=1969 RepID=UPI003D916B4F
MERQGTGTAGERRTLAVGAAGVVLGDGVTLAAVHIQRLAGKDQADAAVRAPVPRRGSSAPECWTRVAA